MKDKVTFIAVTPRNKDGKEWFDCWISIDGYSVPYRINVWEQNGIKPEKGMTAYMVIDQDRYCAPVLRIRL